MGEPTERERHLQRLLDRWALWWDGPGRHGYHGPVIPPLRDTREALGEDCTLHADTPPGEYCRACGRTF